VTERPAIDRCGFQRGTGDRALGRVRDAIADERASACALGVDGEILLVNAAWDAFARENGGAPDCLGERVVGRRYFAFLDAPLRAYHEAAWLRVLAGRATVLVSGCGAPGRPCQLSTHLVPVRAGPARGVILHATRPLPVAPEAPVRHADGGGRVEACSACRRVRRDGGAWEYRPECIDPWPEGVHGFCPTCARLARAAGA
jgi:hypothetical protein